MENINSFENNLILPLQKTNVKKSDLSAKFIPKGALDKDTWVGSGTSTIKAKPSSWVENALGTIKKMGNSLSFKGKVDNSKEEDVLGYDGADDEYALSREEMRERCLEGACIFDDEIHSVKKLKNPTNYSEQVTITNIDENILQKANLDNLNKTVFGGYRGKMLAKGMKSQLAIMKESGINHVIDLRAGSGKNLDKYCSENGVEYLNFPIVLGPDTSLDSTMIENLPKFIDIVEQGDFYIGCATGSQRTDVGLAFAYCFNPNAENPPLMLGYASEKGVNFGKIDETLTRVYRQLTPEQKVNIGGEQTFLKKRKLLKSYHKKVVGSNPEKGNL